MSNTKEFKPYRTSTGSVNAELHQSWRCAPSSKQPHLGMTVYLSSTASPKEVERLAKWIAEAQKWMSKNKKGAK